MLGIIPHTIDQYLKRRVTAETRMAILLRAGFQSEQQFRLDTEYDDAECCALVAAIADITGCDTETAFDEIADFFLDWAEQTFPGFFAVAPDTRNFLMLQPDIHSSLACGLRSNEQRKVAEKFRAVALPDGIRMHYRSSNRLAYFYCSLARNLAARRGEVAEISFIEGSTASSTSVIEVRLKPKQATGIA
ncbi:MAG TPA: heme NO-binding domain-containing protein [Acidiphilium sp.]|uniref:heme NO-binding domain-containing protein n=1 Tax=unclassified Acidiphilium TaxID=2617493 RepID=UPI000BC5AFB7|nr:MULTISPECIES: heme NO-binding domain-containing protein [unclassified Acidiphilium]OYV56236.1 MAG: hypothetical protein B7Z76_07145 [Acidiphilium sp. 20-67-58]HQT62572.1 heme NO-binding domain-containing protein [Acidiphilium sp.]HQU12364.1 heme NO-binding domain-containing protein [Acidiphilium sp.]